MEDLAFKRLLTPCRMQPEDFFCTDWTLNLYRGCNHGCVYCDSRSVCYRMEGFDQVRVKRDCLPALERELRAKQRPGVVGLGAASDAYNAREAELGVTRGALQLLKRYGFGVCLSTKSGLIARDAALLGALGAQGYCLAAFSITTGDEVLAALLEPGAPNPSIRFGAMEALASAGVFTGVWINPVLPFLTDTRENLRALLRRTAEAGGRFALCSFAVTLREGDRESFFQMLDAHPRFAGVIGRYAETYGLSYVCVSPQAESLQAFYAQECDRLGLLRTFEAVNRAAADGAPRQMSLW